MRYEVTTGLTPHEALARAITHFGPGGVGLDMTSQSDTCLIFEGGGGHVAVAVQPETPSSSQTVLELETREWDYPVRQFMQQVAA